MRFSVKFILAFVLLMLSYSMSNAAMSLSTCISATKCSSSQLSEASSNIDTSSSFSTSTSLGFDKSQSLSISDAEMAIKSVSEIYNNYRLRRIIEANDLFKDVLHKFFLLRENILVLDQSKSYYSDKDPHYSTICSDYYVFALRRIFI